MSDASSSIEVIARVRPMNGASVISRATTEVVTVDSDATTLLVGGQRFSFSAVAGGNTSQESFFDLAGRRVCDAALAGYNCTLFAYGQTGSGKTHTIYGGAGESRGLLPRTLEYIFAQMRAAEVASGGKTEFTAKASFLEVRSRYGGRRNCSLQGGKKTQKYSPPPSFPTTLPPPDLQ